MEFFSSLICFQRYSMIRNNPRQLGALRKLLLLRLLIHIRARRNVVAHLEHAVLQRQQLGQRVVEERRAESHIRGRLPVVGQPHFKLARGLLGGAGGRGGLLGGLLTGFDVPLALDECDVLGHFGDAVGDSRRHYRVRRHVGVGAVGRAIAGIFDIAMQVVNEE
ncbi:hypothetical protein HBI55_208630 [Parastagonospora nodorum]|nr:hypothetical protein HBH52_010800 [Parastagonospora nodorum]KAH4151476.1 hypothetical protein HBH43_241330 [Parastagonospora nodorum]KAH4931823.1 hypothetical protein HBH74_097480 [Parastagonospora nodorum]KAH5222690.1 hypothetical protein HBH77_035520 [Parastagonospora nodorum]KAH5322487.1 hypothetical protein HBI12_098900 [Parastagonospora nodorum]